MPTFVIYKWLNTSNTTSTADSVTLAYSTTGDGTISTASACTGPVSGMTYADLWEDEEDKFWKELGY